MFLHCLIFERFAWKFPKLMTSAQVVETSVTTNSSFQNYMYVLSPGRSHRTKYGYSCVQIIHFNTGHDICLFYVARIHHVYVLWKGTRAPPISGVQKLSLFSCHSNKVFILHTVNSCLVDTPLLRTLAITDKIQIPIFKGLTENDSWYYGLSLFQTQNDIPKVSAIVRVDSVWQNKTSCRLTGFSIICHWLLWS